MAWAKSHWQIKEKAWYFLQLFVLKFLCGLSASHWTKDVKVYRLFLVRSVISSFFFFWTRNKSRRFLFAGQCIDWWNLFNPHYNLETAAIFFALPKMVYLDLSTFMGSDKIGHHASQTTSRQSRLKGAHSGSPTHDVLWNYKPLEGRRPIKVAYPCAGLHLWKYFTAHLCGNDPLGQTRLGLGVF